MENINGLEAKRQLWRERYEDYKQSGLTQAAYCRKHKLPIKLMGYWTRKYRREEYSPAQQEWALLSVTDKPALSGNHQLTLQMDQYQLRIPAGFDQKTLAFVIQLLRS